MDVNVHQLRMLAAGVSPTFAASQADTALATYQETARTGRAGSWRSAQYRQHPGLERMQARQAHAASRRQLFSKAAYRLQSPALTLEPFTNLTCVQVQRDAFEQGDAAALRAADSAPSLTRARMARARWAVANNSTAWG